MDYSDLKTWLSSSGPEVLIKVALAVIKLYLQWCCISIFLLFSWYFSCNMVNLSAIICSGGCSHRFPQFCWQFARSCVGRRCWLLPQLSISSRLLRWGCQNQNTPPLPLPVPLNPGSRSPILQRWLICLIWTGRIWLLISALGILWPQLLTGWRFGWDRKTRWRSIWELGASELELGRGLFFLRAGSLLGMIGIFLTTLFSGDCYFDY